MHKDKLLLLFPDGVGIRNYLYAHVFDPKTALVLFHNFDDETIAYLKQFNALEATVRIPDYNESAVEKLIREALTLSRLFRGVAKTNNLTLLQNWPWKQKSWSKKVFYTAVEWLAKTCKSDRRIQFLDRRYQKAIRSNGFYTEVKKLLAAEQPKAIFCSHQRALKAAPIFAAAKDLGIPTVTVIYSWDNLPKARLALKSDQYWVWSEAMKQDMQLFYPAINPLQIKVTGTPQFEFYKDPQQIMPRKDFFANYQLDPAKKTICFSGDDEMTSPDDPKYLFDLAETLTDAGMQTSFQILLRRSPADLSGRYDAIIAKFPDLIKSAPPLWSNPKASGWAGIYPLYDDVSLLVSTAFYCDLVVNIGSTMVFDFAMFDKPCFFLNYDQPVKQNKEWSVRNIYRFQHFRSMDGLEPVGWITAKDQFVTMIRKAVEDPASVGPDRKKWMQRIVGTFSSDSFKKIAS